MRQPFLGGAGSAAGDAMGVLGQKPGAVAFAKQVLMNNSGTFIATVGPPWIGFTLMLAVFTFAMEEFKRAVWVLVTIIFLAEWLVVITGVTGGANNRSAQLLLSFFMFVSSCVALPIGLSIESNFMREYWRLDFGATYSNVGVQDPVTRHSDAVFLDFVKDAYVDVHRTVGYMKRGTVYCIAPVSSPHLSESPLYWVIGEDCCGRRGDFECGSVYNEEARSGIVVPDATGHYASAVRVAASAYSLALPSSPPVYLRWTEDVEEYKDHFFSAAASCVALASVLHLLVSTVFTVFFLNHVGKYSAAQRGSRVMGK